MATQTTLSDVFPLGSRVNERGRLEVGGCDTIELAREFGTPAYVVAEDDLRARAHAFTAAGRGGAHEDFNVVFASKAFPCTAVLALFAQEGLWCDVASGGELHLALGAGFAPERVVLHGNAKSEQELRMALERRVGLIVLDNFGEIERLALVLGQFQAAHVPPGRDAHVRPGETPHAASRGGPHAALPTGPHAGRSGEEKEHAGRSETQEHAGPGDGEHAVQVLIRVTPDVRGDTHEKISTGQADSKFGFSMADAPAAIAHVRELDGVRLAGVHAHIGSQLLDLEPFRREAAELAKLGEFGVWDLGGGLGVRYTSDQPEPPSIESYVSTLLTAAREHGMCAPGTRLLIEPGRALCANSAVTLYTVESVKQNVSRWVAVDGGMSDNLRPMLYGARYEAHVADRLEGATRCVLAGKHCESGDVIVREALLDDPRPGDVVVTPATGAYGFAMANNYNGVPRPPVIFCRDGDARVVVRRESFEDLTARDAR